MAPYHLVAFIVDRVHKIEALIFGSDLGVHHYLEHHVAQFFPEIILIVPVYRVYDLIRLLDHASPKALMGLHLIPWAELSEQLRRETQSKVTLNSACGIFPTVTKFGMAALLPHNNLEVVERTNGMLAITADGQSTDAGYRDKVLKSAARD